MCPNWEEGGRGQCSMGRKSFSPTASSGPWLEELPMGDPSPSCPSHLSPLSPCRLFPIQRSTSSFLACGRVSGSGLSGGLCGEALGWVCEQSAATLQWLRSSSPAFLWGNTTYTCVGP